MAGIKWKHRKKAATTTIQYLTSGLHAQFSYHYGGQTKTCRKKLLTDDTWKPEDEEVPYTEKWISTLVPAPKRSTLGVVAALDSVVGLCSGIESNISTNKDTQSHVHSEFKSSAYR